MVECPICHTSNPPGTLACTKCSTPIEMNIATVVIPPEEATVLDASLDPEATQVVVGGTAGWSVALQKNAPDTMAPIEPGTMLGDRYEILKRLGEGGMGAVYKARDRELERLVALKVIRPELAGNPDILRRFKQELILARQVTHKNVIRIFDLGVADGRKFITMDYIEGRDLKSILVERGKLPPEEAVSIIQQVCRGLEAAHTEGVVHRDLKPQNIMVDANGRVWVMDFGLARSMEMAGITRTGALMGTPDYMSPEQARGEKVDARSDLFSLGIIFYEMLTGRLPFQADTMMATLLKRVQEKAIAPRVLDAAIPDHLSAVVMRCLEADVTRRYQAIGEILADLTADKQQTVAGQVQPSVVSLAAIGPGTHFGPRYRIESVIGEGGMGKVYKAYDKDLDRTVALKVVRAEFASDPNSMQRFKQELLLASRISHRNILRIHDLGDVDGLKFISMAYVEGKDLHDLLTESGKMPIERAVNIAKQLASALEAAHTEGVVHRDLKPRNVLIDQTDHVYVSDFGLAKSLEGDTATQMTRAGEVLGTPRYMSPEQAESKPADHRSDIYSFGVILYEMVTGEPPFGGDSTMQVMYQHVTQKAKNPKLVNPEVPDYLAAVILRCLEKDPALRYPQARLILHDLESATAPTRIVRLRIAETGYPKWLLGSMAALLLLVGATLAIPSWRNAVLGRLQGARGGHAAIPGPRSDKHVAVLPFKVLGDEAALKYAADGIVDSLSAQLFQLKNIYVASPSAVEQAGKKGSVDQIAKALGVNLVVEGTVQGAGDKIGIVVSVQDVKKGQRLWGKEFSGLRRDLLTIENSIYSELVSALDLKPTDEDLTRGAMRMTGNYSAYELYLKGRDVIRRQPDAKGYTAALKYYDQAIQKDSRFALAYAGIADTSIDMYDLKKEGAWSQKALGAAQQAQQLNPDLPEVHWALGNVYMQTGKTEESIAEMKQAVELAPNSDDSYRRLGHAYERGGHTPEAIAAYQKATEINPYYWFNFSSLGIAYFGSGYYEKALNAFRRVTELAPDLTSGYNNLAAAYYQLGRWNEALATYQKSLALEPNADAQANVGTAYYYLGLYSEAAKALEKAVQMDPNNHELVAGLAEAYRQMGQRDKAMTLYETAIRLALKAYQVNPRDATTLGDLATYYAKKGDLNRAQDFMTRARTIDPDNNRLMYDEAWIQARAGKSAEAFKGLRAALLNGYPPEVAKSDPELSSMRSSAEFEKLIKEFSRKPK
ncbi:MAG: protein kinase [Acidobacteriia bacterium]|nr:protein kinase [Terriglobia bacterium]